MKDETTHCYRIDIGQKSFLGQESFLAALLMDKNIFTAIWVLPGQGCHTQLLHGPKLNTWNNLRANFDLYY